MKLFLAATLAAAVTAAPTKRAVTDADILQYALTLEHLENTFYKEALNKFSCQDFLDAGYTEEYFSNVKYIARDEEVHVTTLATALTAAGAKPVAACKYNFPMTDVKGFVTLSSVLEGVGTSAYLGGAGLIQNKDYLGVAGSILVTEALHTSLQRFQIKEVAFPNPFGTGLGINEVYTLAAGFIKSCPSSNAKLPVKAFPTLMATQGAPAAANMKFTFQEPKGASMSGQMYITWISGLSITSVPATNANGMISTTVPPTAMGQTYAVLTNQNVTKALTDDQVIAGPAIVEVTPPAPTYDNSVL